ncbi:lysyl oxidase 2A [Trichonephila clavipes]|nr:lysyl oxidase 2A [Trichonephila clavipes]
MIETDSSDHSRNFGTFDEFLRRAVQKIWMDNLYCQGHEKNFQECRFDGWGIHDCAGSEAAGVECEMAKNDTKLESLVAKKPTIIRSKFKIMATSGSSFTPTSLGREDNIEVGQIPRAYVLQHQWDNLEPRHTEASAALHSVY